MAPVLHLPLYCGFRAFEITIVVLPYKVWRTVIPLVPSQLFFCHQAMAVHVTETCLEVRRLWSVPVGRHSNLKRPRWRWISYDRLYRWHTDDLYHFGLRAPSVASVGEANHQSPRSPLVKLGEHPLFQLANVVNLLESGNKNMAFRYFTWESTSEPALELDP